MCYYNSIPLAKAQPLGNPTPELLTGGLQPTARGSNPRGAITGNCAGMYADRFGGKVAKCHLILKH